MTEGGVSPASPTPRLPATLRRRLRVRSIPGQTRLAGYAFLLPAAALYTLFVLVPLVKGVRLSLYAWDGVTDQSWIGFENFRTIAEDSAFRAAFVHAFVLIIFFSLLPIVIGLLIAGVASRAPIRGFVTFRTILFIPVILPLVAVGAMWRWIYAPHGGLNGALSFIGLNSVTRGWLGDYDLALIAVGLVGTWVVFGLCMILFLAGVQRIPKSLYDAARVDGASAVREFFAVTMPGIRGEISVALVITVIGALRSFDVVYVTTQGGPGNTTAVPAYSIYREAFFNGKVGLAAALGVVLGACVIVVTAVLIALEGRGARRR
jgi:raffinose/stachyose/melibiose transport system permease protein